jgi:hypothetical protein
MVDADPDRIGSRAASVLAKRLVIALAVVVDLVMAPFTPRALGTGREGGFDIIVTANQRRVTNAPYLYALRHPEATWVGGDRLGYRCAYMFLEYQGAVVGRVTFTTQGLGSAAYTVINDQYMDEGAYFYDGTPTLAGTTQTGEPGNCRAADQSYTPLPASEAGDLTPPLPVIQFTDASTGVLLESRDYARMRVDLDGNDGDANTHPGHTFRIVEATATKVTVVGYQDLMPVVVIYYELPTTSGHEFLGASTVAMTSNYSSSIPSPGMAAPTITSLDPTSGPIGSMVTIVGSGFLDGSVVSDVRFNGAAATFTVNSDTEIIAAVPTVATDGPISVTDSQDTATSPMTFDVTPSPLPFLASFSPAGGSPGTSVVIDGSGFTGTTSVTFNGSQAIFEVSSDTQITAVVPWESRSGPIAVTTPGGTAVSSTMFKVENSAARHRSRVTLKLSGHFVASGRVTVQDGTDGCARRRLVTIEMRYGGDWRSVAQDRTNASGSYRARTLNRPVKYRSVLDNERLANGDLCTGDISRSRLAR